MKYTCEDCERKTKCPNPFVQSFIEQINQDYDIEMICPDFFRDPTDDPEFIINIWGI